MKVAISLPDPVFDAAERVAEELKVSRSQLYARALSEYLERSGSVAITAKLNEVYAQQTSSLDPAIARAQARSVLHEAW